MKYHIIHLGCQMNQSDAERIQAVIEAMGYEQSDHEEEAELLGIVACSVRQKAIDKVYSKIHQWNLWKQKRSILTFVSGCILPADKEKFLDRFDLLFGIHELPYLPEMIAQYGVTTPFSGGQFGGDMELKPPPRHAALLKQRHKSRPASEADAIEKFWHIKPHYRSPFEAFIPIQNGCDKFCTFCAVPYTRGREVSRPHAEILKEAEALLAKGYRSITLLGQNVNSYGLDKGGGEISFPELMRQFGELGRSLNREDDFLVYFTSPHPRDMTLELLEVIASYRCLAKQIHLPLQSGDDKLLIKMNRNHSVERYRNIVNNIRNILPSSTLFTDIIVGFTGETEEQFQNTCRAMEEFQYNMAYVAMYSPRPGAASSRWTDDVPHEEKKRRLKVLSGILHESSGHYNQKLMGRTLRVLVEGWDRHGKYLLGRTEGKLPLRFLSDDESLIGQFVQLRIRSASSLSLEGELVALPEVANA